ncbi:(p)ppGpp synthetase [Acidovorax sp. GBBC 3334]|uniref:GTP pyrophosphokinase n=1 Tax=Acidovorax sp. GBBC 3334 TaxID=2940496 RepID=UPI0023043822|nr:(p)ppGpp synthetase [Acidovorax sp. GBBC 3334]MDA8457417.1 (p)ppGpp synthetase [Acidovorax sp. GBBC 3334]
MPSLDFSREERGFEAFYEQELPALQYACASYIALLQSILSRTPHLDITKVEGRIKDRQECIAKFSRKYRAALEESNTPYEIRHYITDLIGVRVVCLYEDELEKAAQAVRSHFDVIDVTDKVSAVESTEGSFGYKGLHLDLRLNAVQASLPEHAAYAAQPFELQVRTIIQDSWSVLDHKIKYKKSIPGQLKRRINVLSALFELADREFRQIRDATEAELRQAPDETEAADTDAAAAEPAGERAGPATGGSELNAFTFLKIANHFFKDCDFDPHKVDLFVADIRSWAPGITRARFNTFLRATLGTVKRYKQYFEETNPQTSFNPYTVIRHCLYLGDRTTFRRALRNSSREAFEAWLKDHP